MTYAPASAPVRPPLRFVVPPGWPEPSPSWVSRNQGWQPPAGWVPPVAAGWPRPAAAPRGWSFWAQEPGAWSSFREPYRRAALSQIRVGAIFMGVGFGVTLLGLLGVLGPVFLILWGPVIFGAIRVVTGLVNLRRADAHARAALASRALQVRSAQDAALYPQYLAETAATRAATGQPAMLLEQLSYALDSEPWGSATPRQATLAPVGGSYGSGSIGGAYGAYGAYGSGYGAVSPWAPPVVEARRSELSVRKRFWIPLASIGAVLIVLVAIGAVTDLSHSPASSAGTGVTDSTGRHWPPNTGNYSLSGVKYEIVDSGPCSTSLGCIQADITAPTACASATITWGFSDAANGDDKAVRASTVTFVAGQTEHVSIPEDSQLEPLKYMFLDSITCA
ncbi:hypothetical protein [Frondihabitans australicus]|uniref:Uncharacterized protein n=1 Tax=Frondihabitans australicus TaxID=386892 RepID=A0A495IG60_9MICO|nr:hypothetical protein [Frondihabitans australicus]RKR74185.1 hypothetical protein C8E83_1293 [Frondihabitans australicus]